MTCLLALTSAVALILTASTSFAAEEATWGQIKLSADPSSAFAVADRLNQETVYFNFGNPVPAAKIAADGFDQVKYDNSQSWLDQNRTKTKEIGRRGGRLVVGHKTLNHEAYTLRAEFHVPAGSLNRRVPITMNLIGDRLEDLVVEFSPAGLKFSPEAKLRLFVGRHRAPGNVDGMKVEHIYEDGTIEYASWYKKEGEKGFRLDIKVPGFSRYSPGGGF